MHPSFRATGGFASLFTLLSIATLSVAVGFDSRQIFAQGGAQQSAPPAESTSSTPTPVPVPAPAPASPGGTPAAVLDDKQVSSILGRNIRGKDGEDMGRIVDVIVNRAGQLRAAVIDFGGFLGVGSRKIAVDWGALRFAPGGQADLIALDLTKEQVRVAPEYKPGVPVVVLGATNPAVPEGGSAPPSREK